MLRPDLCVVSLCCCCGCGCGCVVCVVWCVGVVCRCGQDFRGGLAKTPPKFHEKTTKKRRKNENSGGKFWATQPSGPLRGTPLRRTAQNFALFFSLLPSFLFFLSLWGSSRGVWWCLKRRCQMCTFGLSGYRVKPRRLLHNVKNNFTIDLPPIRLPKKSMTICCKFCLHAKKNSNTTEIPRDDASLSHLRNPHLLALTFSGLLLCC